MCGNANINEALEHVWEITLCVINGCTRYQKTQTGGIHDVISSVPASTNMCGPRDTGESMKCAFEDNAVGDSGVYKGAINLNGAEHDVMITSDTHQIKRTKSHRCD